MHVRLIFVFCEGLEADQRDNKYLNLKLNKFKFHNTSKAYVKKLSQFLYCDWYGTTFTCKHKDIRPFNQLTVVSKQLINAS
jgi:hypothetical protein